jgi:Protein ENHANCED DISEASE RESISTANCE 2, C-terminal
MTVNFGLCVESREEESMPETILGCITMNKIIIGKAVRFVDSKEDIVVATAEQIAAMAL